MKPKTISGTIGVAIVMASLMAGCASVTQSSSASAGSPGTASPDQSASAPPSTSPSPAPAATHDSADSPRDLATGFIGPGRYAVHSWVDFEFTAGEGWGVGRQNVGPDFWILPRGETTDTGWFWAAAFDGHVFSDPCRADAGQASGVGDAAGLMQHIKSIDALDATTPSGATIGGRDGLTVDITSLGCEGGTVSIWPLPTKGNPIHFDVGERARLWAVDVEGRAVVLAADAFGTIGDPEFEQWVQPVQDVLTDMVITP